MDILKCQFFLKETLGSHFNVVALYRERNKSAFSFSRTSEYLVITGFTMKFPTEVPFHVQFVNV